MGRSAKVTVLGVIGIAEDGASTGDVAEPDEAVCDRLTRFEGCCGESSSCEGLEIEGR